jgi:hypothetical protein
VKAIDFGQTTVNTSNRRVLEVQNKGNAKLVSPTVTVTQIAPTPAGTFQNENDRLSRVDVAAGESKTVDLVFKPNAAGQFSATLTIRATNLTTPAVITLSGRA